MKRPEPAGTPMLHRNASPPTLTVASSFFNERNLLPLFLRRVRAVCQKMRERGWIGRHEIILVDDASTDDSLQVLQPELAAGDLVILALSRNFGVGECNWACFQEAKGDLLVYMDCDLQDPPEVMERMVETWHAKPGTEVVYTTRIRRRGEAWWKLWVTKIGYRLIDKISTVRIPLDSGDFKLLSRRVVDLLVSMPEARPYTRGMISWLGFRQEQVWYEREERADGGSNTKMPVLSGKVLNYWLDSALISFSDLPLKVILLVGFGISAGALAYLVVIMIQKIMGWHVPGWPALMTAILFLGGIQTFLLGVVGLYIAAIFKQTKNRPLFIVNQRLGSTPLA